MERLFRQVDVFGDGYCAGNPVAVVLDADGLDDDAMRRFSIWSNLSECTFVLAPTRDGADYRVRIFSLSTEFPFAGHPTLGTARAWLDAGGKPADPSLVVQECAAGLIPIRIDAENLAFRSPALTRSGPVDPTTLSTVIAILGVDPARVVDSRWLDNGPGWLGVLLDNADTVFGLRPDATRHPGRWDIGVIGPHRPGAESEYEVRAFFTEGDGPLREDPATGSLNGAAAEWLLSTNRATTPYVASQGQAIGRNARIHLSGTVGDIWVSGSTRPTISGTITL